MSAFVVSATHVDVLLSVALHGPCDGSRLAQELRDQSEAT